MSDLLAEIQQHPMAYGAENAGKVYLAPDAVYRVVGESGEPILRFLISHDLLEPLARLGMVETYVRRLSQPPARSPSIVEHRRVRFVTLPPEWSPSMLLEAATFLCNLSLALDEHGLMLKDGHAFNVTFDQGRPVFLDFGSLSFRSKRAEKVWLEEFRTRVLLPLWVATWARPEIVWHILRTEPRGLSWYLAKTRIGWHFPPAFRVVRRRWQQHGWKACLLALLAVLDRIRIAVSRPNRSANPEPRSVETTPTEEALLQHLQRRPPASIHVLDGQTGSVGELLAARTRAHICSTDPNVRLIEQAHRRARSLGLPLDVAVLDVLWPTPPYGAGNSHPGAVTRLRADCVLAVDLIGRLILRQRCTMDTFAQIVSDYGRRSAIVEFVHLDDASFKSRSDAGKPAPADYNLENFLNAFLQRFPACETFPVYHATRTMYEFTR